MSKMYFCKNKGFSLVELMIVVGIMSFVAVGIASMISDMSNGQAALEQKLATIESGNGLQRAFSDPSICSFQLNQGVPPVDLTAVDPTIIYPEIRMGLTSTSTLLVKTGQPLPGYSGDRMRVQSIKLKNITLISGNNFSGDLEVVLDPTTTKRSIKPFGAKSLIFTVTPPLNAAVVSGCGASGATNFIDPVVLSASIPTVWTSFDISGLGWTNPTSAFITLRVIGWDRDSNATVWANRSTASNLGEMLVWFTTGSGSSTSATGAAQVTVPVVNGRFIYLKALYFNGVVVSATVNGYQ